VVWCGACHSNAAELATYDQAKEVAVKQWKWADNLATHLVCATTAGFVATCAGSPADVVKTRVMNQKIAADGTKEYRNAIHCLTSVRVGWVWCGVLGLSPLKPTLCVRFTPLHAQIISKEGPMALYKGFLPNFARIGTWNIVVCVPSSSPPPLPRFITSNRCVVCLPFTMRRCS
jgi:solute carrier family 25 uncoupling protein 8/9